MENMQRNVRQEPTDSVQPQQKCDTGTAPGLRPGPVPGPVPQPGMPAGAMPGAMPAPVPGPLRKPDTPETRKMKENFHIFGLATFLYACLYAYCMYRNSSGVTYPFFVAGSLFYICFCFAKQAAFFTWAA